MFQLGIPLRHPVPASVPTTHAARAARFHRAFCRRRADAFSFVVSAGAGEPAVGRFIVVSVRQSREGMIRKVTFLKFTYSLRSVGRIVRLSTI